MKEYCRLSYLCLLKFFICSVEHDVCYLITENVISLVKKFFCQWITLVQVFAHTYKLRALAGKHECFHMSVC